MLLSNRLAVPSCSSTHDFVIVFILKQFENQILVLLSVLILVLMLGTRALYSFSYSDPCTRNRTWVLGYYGQMQTFKSRIGCYIFCHHLLFFFLSREVISPPYSIQIELERLKCILCFSAQTFRPHQ